MQVVYSERHRLHATDRVLFEGHPFETEEVPNRVDIIRDALAAAEIGPITSPTDHGEAPILAVHSPDYVAFLRDVHVQAAVEQGQAGPVFATAFATHRTGRRPRSFLGLVGYYAFGWGTPVLEGTWDAAYWAVQCALTAADLVLGGEPAAYALCRPPGHHAAADLYGGFCYLNNAAIAARYLQRHGPVAILDIDYHHGNGTQSIFYSDPNSLVCSLHAHPDDDYPYYWGDAEEQGDGPGEGLNRNWPLPPGTSDDQYMVKLDEALHAIRSYDPRFLVVSAGFDIAQDDPVGRFRMTRAGIARIGYRISSLGLPTLIVQEGGYALQRLGGDVTAFLQAFSRPAAVEG
jgi:acetoin utilization deacetylase AcuC-like enzyme